MSLSATEILQRAEPVARRTTETLVAMQGSSLNVSRKERRDVVTAAD